LGFVELFEGRHFDREIIVLCVRWYLRFKLSFLDLVEMMAERCLSMGHTTIMRWVHRYAPSSGAAAIAGTHALTTRMTSSAIQTKKLFQ
jgi:transposase-like protein